MAPEGVIVGGWSYVVAAYSVTLLGLVAYAWSLARRWRRLGPSAMDEEPAAAQPPAIEKGKIHDR